MSLKQDDTFRKGIIKMKNTLRKIYWLIANQLGIDLRKFAKSIVGMPHFIIDLVRFSRGYNGQLDLLPCLHDWHAEGGSTRDEYFWQDLHVAQKVYISKPKKHVDIGSRIDGFVAHVASFREIEVFDIRPITSDIPCVISRQADLMNSSEIPEEYCDSVSCLHALEHFGLGRYADPINPLGYEVGLKNMAKILQDDGLFYLSVPIGVARVEFNAHRIFNPHEVVRLAEINCLQLEEFAWIRSGVLTESVNPVKDFDELCSSHYALGIFTFRKQTRKVES